MLTNRTGTLASHGFMLVEAMLKAEEPDITHIIFNAEDNAHAAMIAMRVGFKQIVFSGNKATYDTLKSIAAAHDVVMKDGSKN